MTITALDILGLYQTEDPISVAMLLGHESPPANPVRGRIVINEEQVKRDPKPRPDGMPESIKHGTRAAQVWRVLPDADDVPSAAGDIARSLRVSPTVVAPILYAMTVRGQITRIVEDDGSFGYTRKLQGDEQ